MTFPLVPKMHESTEPTMTSQVAAHAHEFIPINFKMPTKHADNTMPPKIAIDDAYR
jgi:hypothetical protein